MNFFSLSLTQAWQLVGWTMILFLAAGMVVLVIGGMLRVILKRANPSVRYATSLATFALLAVAPIAIAGYIATSLPHQWGEITTKYTNDTKELFSREAQRVKDERAVASRESDLAIASPLRTEPVADESTLATSVDIAAILNQSANYLPWIWCVGTPLTFLVLAAGLIGAERLRGSCDTLTDGPVRTACDELLKTLRVGRRVGVAVCERIATPLLVGVVKPLILLPPAALNGWTTAELEMVLVHELAHVRRWDNAVNLMQRIVESLLFFHPAVWIVSSWVRRDREDCCDAAVVRHTATPQAYAELLLALASHTPGLATSAAMAQHPVAGRVRRILKLEDEPMLVTRKGLFVGVSTVVVAALLVFALPTTDAEEPFSREAERVADERAETTNPTRKRGEEKDLTTEDTESTEENSNKDSVQYTVVYALGDNEAEIKEWLAAVDELGDSINMWTKDGKDMAVVTGTRAGHEKLSAMFESIRSEASRGQPRASATGQRPEVSGEANRVEDGRASNPDIKTVRSWFKFSDSNPLQRGEYAVPPGYAAEMEAAFEGFQSDPYGPRASFEWQWIEKGKVVSIGAPSQAHDKWFRPLFERMAKHASLFPTLEEQRAADLAYKLLGVELEKLTPEELERVKAAGYKGGLRVTGSNQKFGIGTADLLVGLHVWPTESLAQVEEILQRYDMDELSPLKYYVVRAKVQPAERGLDISGIVRPLVDQVVTGRIQVDLQAWADKEGFKQGRLKQSQPTTNSTSPPAQPGDNPFAGETDLLYDGKTFNEWRSLWKTELKTEKRIECIKALAAFGRAGKGQEAAEAILDVAGEYDFGKGEGSFATDLKSAISQVLTDYESIPGQYWLPLYIERLKKDPDKWSAFADWVLTEVSGANTLGYLKQIAADSTLPEDARNTALAGIASHPEVAEDADALQMVREALLKDPPVMEIVNKLRFDRMVLFPQQVEPLLDKDNAIRHQAINSLQGPFYRKASIPILNELLKVIDDPNRAADHAGAISALTSLGLFFDNVPDMGKRRQEVTNRLAKILVDGDVELLAVTLRTMSTLSGQSAEELVENVLGKLADKISDARREALKKAAEQVKEWMGGGGAF